jgi:hypothetical protein
VAEPDYHAHHVKILYALRGLPLRADEDPYIIDGWNRDLVKRAVLIIINASTLQSAVGAITQKFAIDGDTARNLVDDIKARHAPIEAHFHSGAGRWLQRIDSEMAERVMLGLIRQGCPIIGVHDSFVVLVRYEGVALDHIDEAFKTVIAEEQMSRIGRPLIGERAMSPAERKARSRAQDVTKVAPRNDPVPAQDVTKVASPIYQPDQELKPRVSHYEKGTSLGCSPSSSVVPERIST